MEDLHMSSCVTVVRYAGSGHMIVVMRRQVT